MIILQYSEWCVVWRNLNNNVEKMVRAPGLEPGQPKAEGF